MTNLLPSAMHEFMAQATPDMLQHNIIPCQRLSSNLEALRNGAEIRAGRAFVKLKLISLEM